jgi:hypothetical protein
MSLQNRIAKLEAANRNSTSGVWDFSSWSDEELLAFNACYDEHDNLIKERITPELEAALQRAKR